MKEKATNTKGKKRLVYYLILAISVALLVTATVLTVYFVAGGDNIVLDKPPEQDLPITPPDDNKPNEPDQPSGGDDTVKFVNPVHFETVSVSHNQIIHNATSDMYYKHQGVDIAGAEGTEVVAMADGKIEEIYLGKTMGNEIVVDHGDGLKTVYRFIDVADGLKAGDTVKQGQKIGTISSAESGSERKDGTHLHLEIFLDGKVTDPVSYLNYGK